MQTNEAEPDRSGPIVITWIVILLVVGGVVYLQSRRSAKPPQPKKKQASGESTAMDLQGKLMFGLVSMELQQPKQVLEQLRTAWDRDSVDAEIRYVIQVGENLGAGKALQELSAWDEQYPDAKKSDRYRTVVPILKKLYQDLEADKPQIPSLSAEEKKQLQQQAGWHGKLALLPPKTEDAAARQALIDDAKATATLLTGGLLSGLCLAGVGVIGLIIFLILLGNGAAKARVDPTPSRGAIYAQTFALWLILFWGLNYGLSKLPLKQLPISPFLLQVAVTALSMLALYWPVYCGISWSTIRKEIGLHRGTHPVVEVFCGIATVVMNLPLLLIGLLIWMAIGAVFGTQGPMYHPIVERYADSSFFARFQIFFLACVMAPLIEETMFRGVLYRHLRELSGQWHRFASFLVSAIINGVLFAAIHPQGVMAIPLLASLAVGFSMAREWRDSLICCMVAHGIHNGIVVMIGITLMG